ncbi:SH3 domain-containing protein [Eubacteriales bacterium OttesenSCG-928-K08]|nr:SH3 domain-containing protein [Eubacteriales bacterium OttesenSCG-928-K08]
MKIRKTHRLVALALILVLCFAFALPAQAASYVKTAKTTYLRSGASSSASRIATIPANTVVEKLGTSGIWTKVSYNNQTGYVLTSHVAATNETGGGSSNGGSNSGGSNASSAKVQATGNVNVRSGPGTNYTKLGQLTKGDVLVKLSESNGWTKVEYKDGEAYVSSTYLKTVSSSTGGTGGTGSTGDTIVQATGTVNVRTGPSTSYTKLGQLKKGAQVTRTGETNGWSKIDYNGKTGYVSNKYLKVISTGSGNNNNGSGNNGGSSTTQYVTITTNNTPVRTGPSTSYRVIAYYDYGEKLEYISTSGSWYAVKVGSQTGYVHSGSAKLGSSGSTGTISGNIYAINTTRVYTGASSSTTFLGYLYEGESAQVLGTSGSWIRIVFDGTAGYVSSSDVSTSPTGGGNTGGSSGYTTVNAYRYAKYANVPCYASASTSSTLYGYLSYGERVYVMEQSSTWAKCYIENRTMYVQLSHLSNSSSSSGDDSTYRTVNAYYNTINSSVPYYSTDSAKTANRLGWLGKNERVYIYEANSTWAKCDVDGRTVYIELLDLSYDGTSSGYTKVNAYWTTAYNTIYYYVSPSTSSARGTITGKGTQIYVYEANSTWAKCSLNNNTVYIQRAELITGSSSGGGYTTYNTNWYTAYSSVYYYSTTSATSANRLGYIANSNTSVYVYEANSTWAKCYYNGQTVYIEVADLKTSIGLGSGYSTVNAYWQTAYNTISYYVSASTSSARGTITGKGTQIYVYEANSTWAKCKLNNNTVYILREDLTTSSSGSGGYYAVNGYRYTSITNVAYYSTDVASSSYRLGYLASKGTGVYVYEANAYWAKCSVNNAIVYIEAGQLTM